MYALLCRCSTNIRPRKKTLVFTTQLCKGKGFRSPVTIEAFRLSVNEAKGQYQTFFSRKKIWFKHKGTTQELLFIREWSWESGLLGSLPTSATDQLWDFGQFTALVFPSLKWDNSFLPYRLMWGWMHSYLESALRPSKRRYRSAKN